MSVPSPSPPSGTKKFLVGTFLVGNLIMIVQEVIFGLDYPIQKLLMPGAMSGLGVGTARIVGGAALFWLASLFVKRQPVAKGDWWVLAGGGLCVFGFLTSYALALQYGSVISVALVLTSQPVLIILLNAKVYRMRVSRLEAVGVVIALAGAVAVALLDNGRHSANASHPLLGDLCAFGSAVTYALYVSITRRISGKYSTVVINRWLFLFAAVPGVCFIGQVIGAPMFHAPGGLSLPHFGELAYVIIMASFVAYFIIPPAIKDIGDNLVGIYGYTTPVFAAIFSVLMGVDTLRWYQPVLFAVIIGGVVLITIATRRMAAQGRTYLPPKPKAKP